MSETSREIMGLLAVGVLLGVLGCSSPEPTGSDSGIETQPDLGLFTDEGLSPISDMGPARDSGPQTSCDPHVVLDQNGCTLSGCHSAPLQANLDLVSEGFEQALLNATSPTEGCEGRLIIDVERPEESLMLQVIGVHAPLGGPQDTCQTIMPPTQALSNEDQRCLNEWVMGLATQAQAEFTPPPAFEPTPVYSGLRKVKTLVNGGLLTDEEVARVLADPEQIKAVVASWSEGDAFQRKLADFLIVSLQQRFQTVDDAQFDRLRTARNRKTLVTSVLEESFVRTAVDIVSNGRPFTEIATTRNWMMTTANLVLLGYPDQTGIDKAELHTLTSNQANAPRELADQIRERNWYLPELDADCRLSQSEVLDMLFGFVLRRRCQKADGTVPARNVLLSNPPLTNEDFVDWRMVELVPFVEGSTPELVPFYDVERLRTANRIATRLPRVGFFTTNVFLNNWATNVDNQYRVTTNQALLVALNIGFSSSEGTEPLSDEGLDAEHAASAPACYGCHKQLDPMRLFMAHDFDVAYQLPSGETDERSPIDPTLVPSFAFRGFQSEGGDTYRFAEILTEHPRFAHAWVQKLCVYANSQRCSEHDPQFLQLVEGFINSGYDFQALWIDVFSSPLITGFSATDTYRRKDQLISVTRLNHLCPLLAERTGISGICDVGRIRNVSGLIPRDDFGRGAVDPTQPALPSAFHFAAAESVCNEVAKTAVTRNSQYFSFVDDEFVSHVVTRLMGLTSEHHRYDASVSILQAHLESCRSAGMSQAQAAREVFSLACLTPDVMGVGL